jgi:nucleotide-binding universal stress UspA family protein
MGRIIVGIDGSQNSRAALQWALTAAHPDDKVVAVNIWDLPMTAGLEAQALDVDSFEAAAWDTLDHVIGSLEEPDTAEVAREVHRGHTGRVLMELSADADLLVVGARGHGGFLALLLGSVSTYAVHHSSCPVVVVPAPYPETRHV